MVARNTKNNPNTEETSNSSQPVANASASTPESTPATESQSVPTRVSVDDVEGTQPTAVKTEQEEYDDLIKQQADINKKIEDKKHNAIVEYAKDVKKHLDDKKWDLMNFLSIISNLTSTKKKTNTGRINVTSYTNSSKNEQKTSLRGKMPSWLIEEGKSNGYTNEIDIRKWVKDTWKKN